MSCCYSLEMSLFPDWDQCSHLEPRAGSVMLRLPLVSPCPGVPASPGGFSGGILPICPRGLCITSSMATSGLQHRQALFAHKLGTALKLPKSHRIPPMPAPLGDLPAGSSPASVCWCNGARIPQDALPDTGATLHTASPLHRCQQGARREG